MIIAAVIFEAYLKCPSKCWLLFLGKQGDANIYSDFVRSKSNAYLATGIERLMVKFHPSECVVTLSVPVNIKTATWKALFYVIRHTYGISNRNKL